MAAKPTEPNERGQVITFVVPGQRQEAAAAGVAAATRGRAQGTVGPSAGRVKARVQVGARRGSAEAHELQAVCGEDVVALHLANGPVLYLHPEHARDLLLAQAAPTRGAPAPRGDEVRIAVGAQLRWHALEQAAPTRGRLGDVLLAAVEVLTGFGKDKLADFAAAEVVRRVDGQVDPGVYALAATTLGKLKGTARTASMPAAAGPTLVMIHGTFVDTTSTFKKLWSEHPARVKSLFEKYEGRVFALDHPTLGASPIANALTLAEACPKGARLHLVTHSRGGLVAEVLARLAHQRQVTKADLDAFPGPELAGQRSELQRLAALVVERDIRVERVVRVACPARGTLLASKRLDAYLSVLKWTLELAKVPVLGEFVDFIAEVARQRADPTKIPGLAAMIPGAPLLNWLNAAPEAIAGDLRVVAGDLQGDSLMGWVKTLLADAYYWSDSDVVVQTRSMYAGAPRAGGAQFALDQGGNVTHFNYFANERTVAAVVNGLLNAAPPEGFFAIGPLSWKGESSAGLRGAGAAARTRGGPGADGAQAAQRPAVFLLPGILGSNLKAGGHRIWLGLRLIGGLDRIAYQPNGRDGVQPDGPVGLIYDDLAAFLRQTHEVIEFGYDWRRPIEEEAQRLADEVERELDLRKTSGQPVRFVAHSMGGLVVRTMQLERPKTWQRVAAVAGARLLMLGTPNGGSWAPMQVLSGDDTFGNTLVAFGSPFADHAARDLMAAMPGFLQLQAGLTDPALKLDQEATWQALAERDFKRVTEANWWHRAAGEAMEGAYRWGVPPQVVLDRAKALRQRLDDQRDRLARGDEAARMLLVVGHAKFTPDGFDAPADPNGDFVYLNAVDGGDGRVPLHCACLPGVRTWKLDAEHGSLPGVDRAYAAFLELLEKGSTLQLQELGQAEAGAALRGRAAPAAAPPARVRSRPSRDRQRARPPQDERAVFLLRDDAGAEPTGPAAPLRVAVHHGDLSFVHRPLMLGHYRALELTGTERVLDRLVGGAMGASLAAGRYPEAVGTNQIFLNTRVDPANPWSQPRPAAAVVVGLGEEGALKERDLVETVRQGVVAWAQRVAETPGASSAGIEMAATLIGSGGFGINADAAARALVRGVWEANSRLQEVGWPQVTLLTLVELFLDRATEAWRGVKVLQTSNALVCALDETITSGPGARRRPPGNGYRGADYDLVRVATVAGDTIEFAIDTQRARTEVRAERTQGRLVRQLVGSAAQYGAPDPDLGRTLFQLLVPVEVEPFLGGTDRVVLDLDAGTAPIPWELLDTSPAGAGVRAGGAGERPWAVRCQLLRKLRQQEFRAAPRDAGRDDAVLVIGEPKTPADWPALPAARAEAQTVVERLVAAGGVGAERITALVGDADAAEVVKALFARPYRVVHIAGHGAPPEDKDGKVFPGGVVLSDDLFLSPLEIAKMRTVPELVFVNCCHLGAHDVRTTLDEPGAGKARRSVQDRPGFAASVADALIALGVRCVVAAGWEVAEAPAKLFADTFYARLLEGRPFIAAVAAAREAAWAAGAGDNTWAAYQCYGDPAWTWSGRTGGGSGEAAPIGRQFDHIASDVALAQVVEDLALQQRHSPAPAASQSGPDADQERQARLDRLTARLRHLEQRFAERWGDEGAVAEAFGFAWETAGERDQAIAWYERALAAQDGSASLRAVEQHANLRVRRAWARLQAQRKKAGARAAGAAAVAAGREAVAAALADLERLVQVGETVERLSLLGSAHKRLALMARMAEDRGAEREALQATEQAYRKAEQLAAKLDSPRRFYPALNRMAAELVLHAGDPQWQGFDREATDEVDASLEAQHLAAPDFWSATSRVELRVYRALAARRLAGALAPLRNELGDIYRRRAAPGDWEVVADQAGFVLDCVAKQARSDAEREAAQTLQGVLNDYARAPSA